MYRVVERLVKLSGMDAFSQFVAGRASADDNADVPGAQFLGQRVGVVLAAAGAERAIFRVFQEVLALTFRGGGFLLLPARLSIVGFPRGRGCRSFQFALGGAGGPRLTDLLRELNAKAESRVLFEPAGFICVRHGCSEMGGRGAL
jgi:hypothetical protein